MKKLFLLLVTCVLSVVLSAQTNYYVSATGDDANDGSSANPVASVAGAFALAQKAFTADNATNNFIINVGAGTFVTPNLSFNNSQLAASITIKGEDAAQTILTGGTTIPSDVRLFVKSVSDNVNLSFALENLKLYNYGFSNTNAGAIIYFMQLGMSFSAYRCAFDALQARNGAILTFAHSGNVELNSCSFDNVTTINNGGTWPAVHIQRGDLTVENCCFKNVTRDYSWVSGTAIDNSKGVVIGFIPSQNWANVNATINNNTFVDCGIAKGDGITTISTKQSLVSYWRQSTGAAILGVEMANNLICGTTLDGITSSDYADIYADPASTNIDFSNCTNNILNAVDGFPTADNDINSTYTYISPEIDFVMNGTELDYDTNSIGLTYATAKGTSVVGGALSAVQPAEDITGTVRATPGCVGAVEYIVPGAKTAQVITFDPIPAVRFTQASTITLEEFASSGLTVVYTSSDSSVATVSGNVVTPVGAGTTTISANQAGDDTYDIAPEVTQDIVFSPDTLNYYVRSGGAGTKDGLSEANAFASLAEAGAAAVADGASLVYVVDVDGTITNSASVSLAFVRDDNVTFKVVGSGASTATVQMVDDAAYATVLEAAGRSAGRVFASPRNSGTGNLTILVEDLTFKNFGFTNDNGGGLFNLNTGSVVVDAVLTRCNIVNGAARSGALAQLTQPGFTLTLRDCFVSEMTTISKDIYHSPLRIQGGAAFTAENCIFSKCMKSAMQYSTKTSADRTGDAFGSVLSFIPTVAGASLSFVNNTVIGDSILFEGMTVDQSALYINSTVAGVDVTIANNIIIGGGSVTSGIDYYSINVLGETPNFIDSTNNVMSSQNGFVSAGNIIEANCAYNNAIVNFTMDNDYPEVFAGTTGVNYVKANGTEVYQKALASIAPDADIDGNVRGSLPSIGAYEPDNGVPTSTVEMQGVAVALYPNPVSEVLYIKGDVASIAIYNMTGALVKSCPVISGQVDVSALSTGVYFVTCKNGVDATTATHRLVKR